MAAPMLGLAQNAIFGGGVDEGSANQHWSESNPWQIFAGDKGDGHDSQLIDNVQTSLAWISGSDDGAASSYIWGECNNTLFRGGVDDGGATAKMSGVCNSNIFSGGEDDGWDSVRLEDLATGITFEGGIDDGYDAALFCYYESTICLGDFDNDGLIATSDLLILLGQFSCFLGCSTDMDGDDQVSTADLLLFLMIYGSACP